MDEVRAGPLTGTRWTPARKTAAAISVCLLIVGVAYTVGDRKSGVPETVPAEAVENASGNSQAPVISPTPVDSSTNLVAQLEETMSALLDAEKEQALDNAALGTVDASREDARAARTKRIQILEERMEQLQQRIKSMSEDTQEP